MIMVVAVEIAAVASAHPSIRVVEIVVRADLVRIAGIMIVHVAMIATRTMIVHVVAMMTILTTNPVASESSSGNFFVRKDLL